MAENSNDTNAPKGPSYSATLNLPKTSFDMKANLVQREPVMLKRWQEQGLYQSIRMARKGAQRWILHDGPPYANGDIHMGHLINKVLKDMVVKYRTMQGYDAPFVPGWDCHGLPIESAIQKELGPKFRELTKDEVRQKCHAYAQKYVKLQGDGFQRLGVLGDFAHPYLTLDHRYESGIIDVLAELVKRDLVYRQKKPVHWCTFDRTALAEAELEYASKQDTSIYVTFALNQTAVPEAWKNTPPDALMIWTTTPWTLPANRAVAIHADFQYVVVSYQKAGRDRHVVLAKELVAKVMATEGVTDYRVSEPISGQDWLDTKPTYLHPLDATRTQPVVVAGYVTLEDGTGLVHTAPGHGKEDYQTGMREGLEVYNPVLSDGKYDDTVPAFLLGKAIWDANALVVEKLKAEGTLFHAQQFDHEYPHCWRCKKPVIFRATEQWFVKATEGTSLLNNAQTFVDQVEFIPTWGKNRLEGMLATRPDWCISRQRSWGVPIPAFFDQKGRTLLTEASTRYLAGYFKQHGADAWYTHTPEQLLGVDATNSATVLQKLGFPADVELTKLEKSQDILDVWFESGASHHAVLEGTHPDLGYPANLYLEGSDQHRGWFQASLLEASGYKSQPPFKQLLTHGFVVDEKGRKMSKSEGNDIKVADALKQYGADVLRLWVCSVDYQNDIPCGPNLLAKTGEAYRKIRNTMRYLLGNLYDFNPQTDMLAPAEHSVDSWMQARFEQWYADIQQAYDRYEFHNVFRLIYEFCNVEISAVYAKAIKDRLYCELPQSPRRRATQTVCYRLLVALIELSAPVLAYTSEEAWDALRQLPGGAAHSSSIHAHKFGQVTVTGPVPAAWQTLMPLVEQGNKLLDELKRSIGLGNPLDAEVVITVPQDDSLASQMHLYGPELEDALGVGYHRVVTGTVWAVQIEDTRSKYPSCARSWKRRPDVGSVAEYPDLSARDATVVASLKQA